MHKISKILLEVASIGWIVFVIIAIIMTLSSCSNNKKQKECDIKSPHYHKDELYTNHPITNKCEGTDSVIYLFTN